jgi:hypothetical protein
MISDQKPYTPPLSSTTGHVPGNSVGIALTTLAHAARAALESRRSNLYADETQLETEEIDYPGDPRHAQENASWIAHRRALCDVVQEYTRQMRNAGQYPEKVIVAVKSTIRDVATPMIRKVVLDGLVCDAAQWSIAAYFDMQVD